MKVNEFNFRGYKSLKELFKSIYYRDFLVEDEEKSKMSLWLFLAH